jgi:AAA+ ATPase superfamily predicted ATPase
LSNIIADKIEMMKFVNRISEQSRLKKALERDVASFVVLYGRRRCGKSRLIRQVLRPTDIYFMADQSERVQQRALLARVISVSIAGFDKVIYLDWDMQGSRPAPECRWNNF